ncbi:hypothetical protein [Nocardia sp. NPDC048505]|uniref:hypothetical protein n=1 Tax=unclassified Nocardia TaxID=2637762 RepID=UPI0033C02E0C
MPGSNDIGRLQHLLRALYVPAERPRVLRTLLHGRRRLPRPLICLVGPAATSDLMKELHQWFGESGGRRAVPRARVELHRLAADSIVPAGVTATAEAENGPEVSGHCLPILQRLVESFSRDDTAMGPIAFPRYRTADWLTRQRIGTEETQAAVELRGRLPRLLRLGSRDFDAGSNEGGDWITRLVFGVLALWPILRLWMWISGRVPGLSKETRWFMHQRYMAPELSDSFLGFATRLTVPLRYDENEEQVAKLLVHAFLEDLRDAYRKRIWRPSSWRRTAYPVALLDTVGAHGNGADLLRRINDIRNETGIFDPLVVVAVLDYDPRALSPARPVHALADIGDLRRGEDLESLDESTTSGAEPDPLRQWARGIDNSRTNRSADAWLLTLELPDPVAGRIGHPHRTRLAVPPAPPLAARKWFVAACVLIPVAVLVAALLVAVPALRGADCAHWPWTSGIGVAERDGECVGYSDNAAQVFADDPELSEMQREVFRQNAIAVDIRRANPRRPLISLVYFSGLTYRSTNERYPHAQVEELAGLVLRQRAANVESSESEPLLRIVVANGGAAMRHADWVVERLLSPLLREDSSVLGVIGFDRSIDQTRRAIALLGDLGVPAFATTLSGNGLEEASPIYFQPVPPNRRIAQLVADYVAGARYPAGGPEAGQPRYRRVTIFQPNVTGDVYVETLGADLRRELTGKSLPVETFRWTSQQELFRYPPPCAGPELDTGHLLLFNGRNQDFGAFVNAVTSGCQGGEEPPILGSDAVTRFIADPVGRKAAPAGLTVRYVAKGVPVILGGADCVEGRGVLGTEGVGIEFRDLCAGLARLLGDLSLYSAAWPGDRTGLAWDVSGAFLAAVRQNRARPTQTDAGATPNRAAIAMELRTRDYVGVTGALRLSVSPIATDATVGILITEDVGRESEPQRCLLMYGHPTGDTSARGPDGCPAGTKSTAEEWAAPR